MADIANLESVAKLLPIDQREKFYLTIQKYRTVPQDDDHLVMLDAMGFIALFMRELPAEISKLLEHASEGLTDDQVKILAGQFSEILSQSLDTPSYKDLRATIRLLSDQSEQFRRNSHAFLKHLADAENSMAKRNRFLPNVVGGLVSAIAVCVAAYFVLMSIPGPTSSTMPRALRPYMELQREGRLDHLDTKLGNTSGDVRVLMISGGVIEAYKDGTNGVVVIQE